MTPQRQSIHPVDENSTLPLTFCPSAPAYTTCPTMDHPSIGSKLIKHIPKSARSACGRRLKESLDDVSGDSDDTGKWMVLLSFSKHYLQPPCRGGKRHNLTAIIRDPLNRNECDEEEPETLVRRKQRNADEASVMAAAVSSNVEDGNIKAAIRILTSDDKPAPNSAETLPNLQDKHPRTAAYNHLPPDDNLLKPLQVTEANIIQTIRSFTWIRQAGGRMGCAHTHTGSRDMQRNRHGRALINHSHH